jgi:Tfp pilus assembly protein PilE
MNQRGVALIELAILLVVLGLLAAVAVPEVELWRQRAVAQTMEGDLLRLAAAQESYFYDYRVYAGDLSELARRGFSPSQGVTISLQEATIGGFSAVASHSRSRIRCFLFVGGAAPVGSAKTPGTVDCS